MVGAGDGRPFAPPRNRSDTLGHSFTAPPRAPATPQSPQSEYPYPDSTSSLCCPNVGAAADIGPGVSENPIGFVMVRYRPTTG